MVHSFLCRTIISVWVSSNITFPYGEFAINCLFELNRESFYAIFFRAELLWGVEPKSNFVNIDMCN